MMFKGNNTFKYTDTHLSLCNSHYISGSFPATTVVLIQYVKSLFSISAPVAQDDVTPPSPLSHSEMPRLIPAALTLHFIHNLGGHKETTRVMSGRKRCLFVFTHIAHPGELRISPGHQVLMGFMSEKKDLTNKLKL